MAHSDPGLVFASSIKDVVFVKNLALPFPMTERFGTDGRRAATHMLTYCSSPKINKAMLSILRIKLVRFLLWAFVIEMFSCSNNYP